MRWLTMSSIQARLLVVSVATILVFIAISQLRKAPIGVYPEFSPVYVEVQTEALGLSADEVEQILTVSLEQDLLNGIAFLDEIWSQSLPGLSRIICIFEPGTDPMAARQVVAERLTQAHALPNVSKPPVMLQPYSSTSRIMKVGLSSNSSDIDLIGMSVLARWNIQPYLMGVEGVANVSIWGQRKRQLQVQVDPQTLKEKGVTLNDVVKTTGEALWVSPLSYLNSSTPGTGGFFDTPNQRLGIRHVLPISGPEDLGNITVHGHNMVLSNVANVVENHQPLIGDAIINGNPGLLLVVEKFPWANTLDVTRGVEKAIEELRPGLSGLNLDTEIFQPARYAVASTSNLSKALGLGLVLAFIMLFIFFYDWRTTLISLCSVVLSAVAGAYILFLRGEIMDMMVLAGFVLALGIILNDAILTVENIKRRLTQQKLNVSNGVSTPFTIMDATLKTRRPLFFATFILLLAALPIFALKGIEGAFLQPVAVSFILAILSSTLVALTVTPALSVILLTKRSSNFRESSIITRLYNFLSRSIATFTSKPVMAYALLGVVIFTGLAVFPLVEKNLNPPALKERDLLIKWDSKNGTSRPEMNRITKNVIKELNTVAGVQNVVAHTGRAVMSDKATNVNSGEIWINLDDNTDYYQARESIQSIVDGYPGLNHKVYNYHEQSVTESLRLSNHLYAIRIYGENQEILAEKAKEVKKVIAQVNGIAKPKIHSPPMEPTIEIEVDLEAARQYEIKPGEVRRAAAILIAGIEAGSIFEGQKVFDVVVWSTPENRSSISSVKDMVIDIPTGGHVRLGDVANVRVRPNPTVINREAVSRYLDVSFDLNGTSIHEAKTGINESLASINFPLEYHTELVGGFEKINETRSRALGYIVAALLGIFLFFQAAFSSWRLATVVFFGMLMALAGGILALFLSGHALSFGAAVGFLTVLGIATQHSILLLRHFRNSQLYLDSQPAKDFVTQGLKDRFSPMMMTTIVIALLFLPFTLSGNFPGLEVIHPMSIVIMGGLLTTLLLNLYVLPALFLQFGKISEELKEEEKAMVEDTPLMPELESVPDDHSITI